LTLTVFGIGNCDTCRKARRWLDGEGIAHRWQDLRAEPPGQARLEGWHAQLGDGLINRRSATWRRLDECDRARAGARLLGEYPTLIRRPLFERGGEVRNGFDDGVRAWLARR